MRGGVERLANYTRKADIPISVTVAGIVRNAKLQIMHSQHNTGTKLLKPLIVVEGIDFWKIIHPDNPSRNITINDIVDRNFFNGKIYPTGDLRGKLDLAGYDIVYVDFEDATDDLLANVELVKKAIVEVNLNKNGTEQNVVLGLSMGAVLARAALKQMENASINHQTRLYISVDGPHQGSNLPLGFQAMVHHLAGAQLIIPVTVTSQIKLFSFKEMFDGLDVAQKVLQTPAMQQLLKYSVNASNGSITSTVHDSFFSYYQGLGYPTLCRNIAISNGSECGTPQPYSPNDLIFIKNSSTSIPWIFDAATSYIQAFGVFTNRPLLGFYAPLALISTKSSFEIDFEVRALPNQTTDRIYKGKVGIKRKVLGLFNVNANIINRTLNATSNLLPYDTAPGTRSSFFDSQTGVPAGLQKNFEMQTFCPLPIVSALDIGGTSSAINFTRLYGSYKRETPPTAPYASPFDNFVASAKENEDHITFTRRNGEFILNELASNTTNFTSCAFYCSTSTKPSITGPVVSGGVNNYSISLLPSGASIEWIVTSPYSIIGSNSSTTVGIVIPSYTNTFAQLVAKITSSCGVFEIHKTLVYPSITATLTDNGPCGTGIVEINVPSGANFVWTADGDINIEGHGKYYTTTSNQVNISGISGTVICSFQNYGRTISTSTLYNPYVISIAVAANPMFGSEPLNAIIQSASFGYSAIRWYLNGQLIQTGGETIYAPNEPPCGNFDLTVEMDLSCGTTLTVGGVGLERYCSWFRNMIIYPNPTVGSNLKVGPDATKMRNVSKVDAGKLKEYEVWLYDEKSRLIMRGKSRNLEVELDTRRLPSANYFLHLRMEGDKEMVKKQVIIRN